MRCSGKPCTPGYAMKRNKALAYERQAASCMPVGTVVCVT